MSKSISLDDLVALNDEIAGLVRSGVPLEMGLASWGSDLPGQLGRTVTRLGESVSQGRSLSDSLADSSASIPPVYRAMVTAGLKSGRLPSALESLATSARSLKEVRGAIGLAVLYPLVLVLVGYFLFVLLFTRILPALMLLYDNTPPKFWSGWIDFVATVDGEIPLPWTDRVIHAVWIPPLALLAAAAIWWVRTRRAMVLDMGSAGRWLAWIPLAGRAVRDARTASLAEILGLLVEHDVPLDEAVVLAAGCTGDRTLIRSAQRMAAALAEGRVPERIETAREGFPPLLAWLIASGSGQRTFTAMARHIADTYRRRIAHEAQWLREFLPMWLMVVVGGSIALVFTLSLFLPFTELLDALTRATGGRMSIR